MTAGDELSAELAVSPVRLEVPDLRLRHSPITPPVEAVVPGGRLGADEALGDVAANTVAVAREGLAVAARRRA